MNDEIRNWKCEFGTLEAGMGMRYLQIGNENPAGQIAAMSAVYAGAEGVEVVECGNLGTLK